MTPNADSERVIERLREAILDIDAHAFPLAEDEDGWTIVGYFVPVGPIHRALGVIGHSAPKNPDVMPPDWFRRMIERACENANGPRASTPQEAEFVRCEDCPRIYCFNANDLCETACMRVSPIGRSGA